ncbi:MAG: TatD family hydrolase [Alphaproteobacteria bacterium]|nr:TatD family hydrolase [Alphaproteobacteria bacterium]
MENAVLVDSHCHLDFEELGNPADVIARAKAAGVTTLQTIGTRITKFPAVRTIAEQFDHVYCSVGIHPHHVEEEPEIDLESLIELTHHPKVIGIGETGLDYYYDHSPRQLQQKSFRTHIAAARATGLPIIIHTRNADEDTVSILQEEMAKGFFPGLIHCFTSSKELADACIALGLYISISGIVTFKNAESLRHTIQTLPLERLLVETDSPYLAPLPHRGKTNEPAYVVHTAQFLADYLGVSYEQLAQQTTANFFKLFSKAA